MDELWRFRLNREVILEQALKIVEAEGVDALTMRRLATALKTKASSFYSYFPDKRTLLADLAEVFVARLEHHDDPNAPWQERLKVFAHSFASITFEHPAAEQFLILYARRHRLTAHFEIELGPLVEAGFSAQDAVRILMTVVTFSIGWVQVQTLANEIRGKGDSKPVETLMSKEGSKESPIWRSGRLAYFDENDTSSFEYGLNATIRGLETATRDEASHRSQGAKARRCD